MNFGVNNWSTIYFNGAKGASVNIGWILVRYSIGSDESNAYMLVGEGIIHI